MEYLWLVLQFKDDKFEIQGIFTAKDKAVATCHTDQFSVVRLKPDEELPIETDQTCLLSWYPSSEVDPT